jgi:hypothetical protein
VGTATISPGTLTLSWSSIGELPGANSVIGLTGTTGLGVSTNPYLFISGVQSIGPGGYVSVLGVYPYTETGTWKLGANLITTQDTTFGFNPAVSINFYTLS